MRCITVRNKASLQQLEKDYRHYETAETMPFAKWTSFAEIAEVVVPDKDGPWKNPLTFYESEHSTTIGGDSLCKKTRDFLELQKEECDMQILSISAGMKGSNLCVDILIRCYKKHPDFSNFLAYIGEDADAFSKEENVEGKLIVKSNTKTVFSKEEIEEYKAALQEQNKLLLDATEEHPFLNSLHGRYVPVDLPSAEYNGDMIYDLKTRDMQTSTIITYDNFIRIFTETMNYITGVEKDSYYNVMQGKTKEEDFMSIVKTFVVKNYINTKQMPQEDLPALMDKLYRALFKLYIVQDLIDDPQVTDVKITAPDDIRARIRGKAYSSNITFISDDDYVRFVTGVLIKNRISLTRKQETFTDDHDDNYILRFSFIAAYVSSTGYPVIHIRKVSRKKLLAPDLIQLGMFDESVRDYLLDCGRHSKGIIFAGPPGSGKTVALNWFLEDAYENSAEILVIQENDELFAYRKGVIFEHVINNPKDGEEACSLEELGKMALVAGANVFVIGEAKGGEVCSAITLSNAGCRTALTLHTNSAKETIDKICDLAMRGFATSYEQTKRSLKSFETIVYMQDFKVQEISQVIGYDEQKKDMIYRCIYKRPHDKKG